VRRAAAVLAGAAVVVATTPTVAAAPMWTTTPSPNVGKHDNSLYDVVALSPDNAWAGGTYVTNPIQGTSRGVLLHWDGTRWSPVDIPPSPWDSNSIRDLDATSADNVWALGSGRSYVLRSTGEEWELAPTTGFPNAFTAQSIIAAPDGGAWITGGWTRRGASMSPSVVRFDGERWRAVRLPAPQDTRGFISSMRRIPGTRKLVAVGYLYSLNMQTSKPYAAVFNGTSWVRQRVPTPSAKMHLDAVLPVTKRITWAVGTRQIKKTGNYVPLVMRHAPRTGWRIIPHPVKGEAGLDSLAAHGPRNVIMTGTGTTRPLVLRFNGSKIVRQAAPTPHPAGTNNLLAVAAIPGTKQYWSVGVKGPAAKRKSTWTVRGR
jgi:hypothetical protein